ncbi:hypothetical protein DL768_010883 [Monosporascus sp. mg162]|nr:hypothetical protein DL768_010883 [Monosporascus sp. mg162]
MMPPHPAHDVGCQPKLIQNNQLVVSDVALLHGGVAAAAARGLLLDQWHRDHVRGPPGLRRGAHWDAAPTADVRVPHIRALRFVQDILSLFFLSDLPSTARFLTRTEHAIAVERVSRNRQSVKDQHSEKYQAVQCLKDPKTRILLVTALGAQNPHLALTSFASMIIGSFLALISGGVVCTRWAGRRCIATTVANTICITGTALLMGLPDANADEILGRQTFISSEATHYPSAYIAVLIGYRVKLVAILALYFYMYRANKARDAAGPADERSAMALMI